MTVTTTIPLPPAAALPHAVAIPWHTRSIRDLTGIPAISKCLLERRCATTFGALALLIDRNEPLGLAPSLEEEVKKQIAKARAEQPGETQTAVVPVEDVLPVAETISANGTPSPLGRVGVVPQSPSVADRKMAKALDWLRDEYDTLTVAHHKSFVVVCGSTLDDYRADSIIEIVQAVFIWTPTDLAGWWTDAATLMARTACDLDDAMRETMPPSRVVREAVETVEKVNPAVSAEGATGGDG